MLPHYVSAIIWSSDPKKLDIHRDKKRIITNVLNLGPERATKWLFKTYSKKEIVEMIENPLPGEWNKKSMNFWSLIFDVHPKKTKRNVL